jgi:hypothetical protein
VFRTALERASYNASSFFNLLAKVEGRGLCRIE